MSKNDYQLGDTKFKAARGGHGPGRRGGGILQGII